MNNNDGSKQELPVEEILKTQNTSQADNQQALQPNLNDVYQALGAQQQNAAPMQGQPNFMPGNDLRQQSSINPKEIVAQDIQKIQNLVQSGVINPLQGQNLMNQVMNKAYEMMVQQNGTMQPSSPAEGAPFNLNQVLAEFHKDSPNFFEDMTRSEVVNYLKDSKVNFDKDELSKISKLVEAIENGAIDKYLKKDAHEKNLNNLNEAAKQKLTANAQTSGYSDKNKGIFTREQIGKMSGAEFAKYEKAIMEQLRKGQIQ